MAIFLQVEGIDVNKEMVSSLVGVPITFLFHLTTTNPYQCCGISLIIFHLQLDTPLAAASREGHTKVVAMLLQVEGIDVNKVRIMIVTITISPLSLTTISMYVVRLLSF